MTRNKQNVEGMYPPLIYTRKAVPLNAKLDRPNLVERSGIDAAHERDVPKII